MPDVRLTRREEKGRLPDVCMCCGEPATDWVDHAFPLHAPVVQGPSGFLTIYAIRLLLAHAEVPRVTLPTSFCPEHRNHWMWRLVILFGGIGGLVAVIVFGMLLAFAISSGVKGDAPWIGCCAIVPILTYMIVWVTGVKLTSDRTIRLRLADDGSDDLVLSNVHPRYIEAMERARAARAPAPGPEQPPGPPPTAILLNPTTGRPAAAPAPFQPDDEEESAPERPRARRRRGKPDENAKVIAGIVAGLLGSVVVIAIIVRICLFIGWAAHQGQQNRQEAREENRPAEVGTVVPKVPRTAPLPPDLQGRASIDLIPLLDLSKDQVHGRWLVQNGVLHCNDANFVPRVQFPYLPPDEYDFVVTFLQPGLRNGIGLIMPHPRGGSFTWYLGNENGAGYGFWGEPVHDGHRPNLIQENTIYTTKVEKRKDGVRGFLDGKELMHLATDYHDLKANDWHGIHDTRFPAVACDDPAVFYYVRIIEISGHGKKAR